MSSDLKEPLIQARGLARRYNVGKVIVTALAEVDVAFSAGEFIALVGPSGSGKSTLLNIIGGLDRPSGGELRVGELALDKADDQQLARYRRDRVGFIFQSFNLLPSFSAAENVESPMILAERPKAERRARAKELLDSVGLSHRTVHRPNELSGGEKQRVAIARALANRPALLLADEPTGNLDSKNGAAILELMCNLVKGGGLTIIMATHDVEVASRADRVIHLRDGKVQQIEAGRKAVAS